MYTEIHTNIVSGINDISIKKNITSKMKEILQYKYKNNNKKNNTYIRKYSKNMKSFIKNEKKEIILFSKIRNEQNLLPYWLKYYKHLGVSTMVIILNNSTDKSLDILLQARSPELKIEILIDDRDFYKTEAEWASELPKIYGLYHWCVNVDIDEFLKFQCRNLPTMIQYLVYNNQFCLPTYLLNVYEHPKYLSKTKTKTKNVKSYLENVYYDNRTFFKQKEMNKKINKYNEKEFNEFEYKHNVYERLDLKNEHFNIKREIKKISVFYMFSKNVNLSGGFHHIYYFSPKQNKKYIFSFTNSKDDVYENEKKNYKKIEINYKRCYHGVLIHLFAYNNQYLQSKFKNKLPDFYDENISQKLDLKNLPYFYKKKLKKTDNKKIILRI